ncbi:hypothetical protein, partial [Chryseobacterium sp. Alg-005]|uniref:hypothetical protein n=1 Tax=Chryseobacterium sp. Alg-005 TaxID=3159516 RepID=UPI0036F34620
RNSEQGIRIMKICLFRMKSKKMSWLGNCIYLDIKMPHIMKSRILKTLIAIVAPLVIEFVVKKISEKLNEKKDDKKQLPAQ